LHTSVNYTSAEYDIYTKGEITIEKYQEYTQAGGGNGIDNILLENMNSITSYRVIKDKLFFYSENMKLELEKE
jgi:hypothetical protein